MLVRFLHRNPVHGGLFALPVLLGGNPLPPADSDTLFNYNRQGLIVF